MAFPENAIFQHRHNEDRSVDSVCPHCYLTVAHASDVQQLFLLESIHDCDPVLIYDIASGT